MFSEEVIYRDSDFTASFTMWEGKPFLHCEVKNFNHKVMRRVEKVFREIAEDFRIAGYDKLYTASRNHKFVKRLGFKLFPEIKGQEDIKVYVWD